MVPANQYINQNFIMEDTGCTKAKYVEYVLQHRNELF